ncbi:peptidase inhibitor family I36 protein [Pseudomonas silesiensis]|jgi:hypothetical protein|uniref:Uncharacterized protein n=1 Tax=Pseudomonas silesiensis TaxID=1853130 RepID=A0A191YY92_9PSED|nr:peptidase inhibitor family I36 protein [Pseudomonas silesiensis]ANJ57860.1 hypothetical protein PMA3_22945 [Pseudomonas silesiensis]VVP39025.1 hypothetical protein PS874_04623 [Pseudomonas fluorescens]
MKAIGFVDCIALCLGLGALFYFYANQASGKQSGYALFIPAMTAEQTAAIQLQIDQQLSRKPAGRQVSATQVVYDNGAVVMTFPVPGDANPTDPVCDYGYFCVWDGWDYTGRKLSLASTPVSRPVNLADYNMSHQVSSWQHNNKAHAVKVFGVDGPGAKGNMVMSNIKEIVLGRGCCPFSIPEQASTKGTWTELNAQSRLVEHNDRIVSVAFSPLFILVAQ